GRSTRSRRGPQQRRRGGGQHPQQQPHPTGSSVDKASLPGSSVASSKKEVVSPTTAISIDSSSVGTPARAVQRVLADAQADALPSSPLSVPQVDTDPVAGRESEKELFRVAEGHGGDRKNVHIASSSGAASTAHEDFNPEDDSVEISKDGPSSQNSSVNGLTIVSNSIEMLPGKSGERGEILADAINSADVTFPTGVRERMSESDVIAGPHDGRKADASSIAHPMTHGIASSESQQQKNGKPVDLSESPLPCPSPIETTVEVSSFSLPSPDSSLLHATTVTDPHVTTHHTSVGMNSGVHTPDSIAPPPPSSAPETTTSMDLSSENTVGLPSSPVITPPPEPHSSWMATNVTPPPVRTSPAETRLGDTSIFHSAPSIEESIASENPKSPPEDDSVPLMASSGSFWTAVSNGSTPQDIASGNGLEYRILQHPFPAHKIAAHLIVYAGSLHEEDNEQGLAHLLEHCVFQGTRKFPSASKVRKELAALGMSFGGDLNAYTDFHHTAYTLHSPVESQLTFENEEGEDDQEKEEEDETQVQQNLHDRDDENDKISSSSSPSSSSLDKHTKRHQTEQREEGEEVRKKKNKDKKTSSPPLPSNLERCLVLLRELAFAPLLESGEPLEAERHAVLSEEQLRHSVQYRVEKKMFAHFH
ncbi:peptidase m16 inactive domain-containing protein, partial [Cystoisospora suis]